jgi:hypothetical protein
MYLDHRVKLTIPGSGDNWTCAEVMDIYYWLKDNIGLENSHTNWDGLRSDHVVYSFRHEADAMLFKIRWGHNGNNK